MARRDFGRYKIIEELGRGAMGVVYKANDPAIGRTVAVKAINKSYLENVGVAPDEYYRRFQREAEVAGRLNHPNVVKIYDLGPDYLVMEYVDGESLAAHIRGRKGMPLSRMLEIVGQVGEALDYAHSQGVVHRDVKPANIMLQPDGRVKVMDFGLARIESSTLTAAGEILGSASYMAPEMILGRTADARSDIFGVGVVAYELMTGERPFGGGSVSQIVHRIVKESPSAPHGMNLDLPPDYDDIFTKVLAKEPAARYAKAGDFVADLVLKKWADRDPELAPAPRKEQPRTVLAKAPVEEAPTVLKGAFAPPPRPAADPGSETVMTVDVAEIAPTPGKEREETPLADLVREVPPPIAAAESTVRVSLPVASKGAPPPPETLKAVAPVLPPTQPSRSAGPVPPPTAPSESATRPPAPQPPKKRSSLPLLVGGVVAFLLVGATAVAFVAYRFLASRYVPAAPSTAPAAAPSIAEPPPSPELAATPSPEASVEPSPPAEPSPAAEASPTAPPPTAAPRPAAPGTVLVASDPSGARVTIGKNHGVTPYRLELGSGRVTVVVEKEGYKTWRSDVALVSGASKSLRATLEPIAKPSAAPTPVQAKAGDLVPLTTPDLVAPKRISGEPPDTPKKKISGTVSVLIDFVVNEDGRVSDIKVVESGGPDVDKECLKALSKWRFQGGTLHGVPVKVQEESKFTFQGR